jgi:hypothetical protein
MTDIGTIRTYYVTRFIREVGNSCESGVEIRILNKFLPLLQYRRDLARALRSVKQDTWIRMSLSVAIVQKSRT